MITYYGMMLIIFLIIFLSKTVQFHGRQKQLVFMIASILIIVSGFRYRVGTDYLTYVRYYDIYKQSSMSFLSQPALTIVARIAALIYDDYATWFFLMALLTIGLIMWSIYKNSINVYLSIVLFVFMGMWHCSFNAVKQYAALAILFFGHKYLIEKNLKMWIVICLIAMTFHVSALIMLPVYFLVERKVDWKQVMLMLALGIGISFSYKILYEIIYFLKQGEHIIAIDSENMTRSVNIFRVLVNCAPIFLYFVFRMLNVIEENEKNRIYINMSLLNAVLYIFGGKSVYLSRFCAYTDIYNVFLVPYLLNGFSKKSRWMATVLILTLYFFFWRYDLLKTEANYNFQWIFNR